MVGGSVFAYQSGTIQTDHYGQVQDGHVVDDIVVGPLGKSAVDVAERLQPVLGHSARERHGMPLGNSHVEAAVGHLLHHDVHRAARRHGRCHAHDVRIPFGQFEQRLTEHLLEFRRLVVALFADALAGIHVKLPRCMPDGRFVLRRLVAVALLRVQMEHLRPLHVLQLAQQSHKFLHVVPVERSEVSDVHALKDVLLMRDGTLQGVAQSDESLAAVFFQIPLAVEPSGGFVAQPVVGLVGVQVDEVFLHAAHRTVYRHVVVVEDDEQVVGRRRYVVESFESQSAAHRAVANHGYHLSSR